METTKNIRIVSPVELNGAGSNIGAFLGGMMVLMGLLEVASAIKELAQAMH